MSKDRIQFFFEGDDYYASLWCDLLAAAHSIFIEVYILKDDEIGRNLKQILIAKAKSGIAVKVIYDGIGSYGLPKEYTDELRLAGVDTYEFHPVRFFKIFGKSLNRRNHRKVVLIDSTIGYLGGFNFHDECSQQYYGPRRWRDTQIRITGEWIKQLNYYVGRSFGQIKFASRRIERSGNVNRIVANSRFQAHNRIRRLFHRYIRRSRKIVSITTAYFVPDLTTMFLLLRALKRGVRVMIIISRDRIDVPLVNRANRSLLKYLIRKGAEVYSYTTRVLHAKTAFFDDICGTVGSANVNYRSFFWDLESNAFFIQHNWIKALQHRQQQDLKECRRITYEELHAVPWWERVIDNFFYLIKGYF